MVRWASALLLIVLVLCASGMLLWDGVNLRESASQGATAIPTRAVAPDYPGNRSSPIIAHFERDIGHELRWYEHSTAAHSPVDRVIRPSKKVPFRAAKKDAVFLHVGSAGGGAVEHVIHSNKLRQVFDNWHPEPRKPLCSADGQSAEYRHVLIYVRDPVHRALSALNRGIPESPQECIFSRAKTGSAWQCCETFAQRLRGKVGMDKCKVRANAADYFHGSGNAIGLALLGGNKIVDRIFTGCW